MPDNADPKRPTFEERLEAVNQTLELLAAMQLDSEKQFKERSAEFEKRFTEIAKAQKQDGENIRALARIAELHHERLSNLEGDQQ